MEIALEKNTRNMSYVNTILRDWHLKGFKTVTDVEAADKAFRAQRLTKSQQQTQAPYQQKGLSETTKNVIQQQQSWEQNIPTDEELAALNQQNGWMDGSMSNDMIRNVEAEQSVLGSIIQEGDLIKDCQLKVKQFSLPTH